MAQGMQTGSLVPSQLVVVVSHPATDGAYVFTGFGQDGSVDIERGEAAWTHSTGTHDFTSRVHNIDTTTTATLHVMQTSGDNDILQKLYDYDRTHYRGEGLFAISILDKSGRTALFSTQAYISTLPNITYGNALNINDWMITMPHSDFHVGGNTKMGSEAIAMLEALGYDLDDDWVIN